MCPQGRDGGDKLPCRGLRIQFLSRESERGMLVAADLPVTHPSASNKKYICNAVKKTTPITHDVNISGKSYP